MDDVLYEKKGKIAYITLDRPEILNAVSLQTAKQLGEIWKDFRRDDEVWVAILSGKGKCFCAGADMGKMDPGKEEEWTIERSLIFGEYPMGPSSYRVWKPLIAAVHGYVLGGGFYLTMECDIRISSEDAEFGLLEPNIGIPTTFTPYMRDHLPPGLAMEVLLLGERISSKRAYEMGLVNRIVKREELMPSAEEMAQKLCEKGPLCLRAMKEVYYRCRDTNSFGTLALIEHLLAPLMNSQDAIEGRKAFQEKRKPQWRGR